MAISSVIKNFRDGTITVSDGTSPTPLSLTVQYEAGDFSIDGFKQGLTEVTTYLDRGELGTVRKTSRSFPTFSFSAHFTDLSDATNATLYDLVQKSGSFSAAVSTLGTTADVFCLKVVLTVEGTNFGDSADHVLTLNDCHLSCSIAEGDPNSYSISGTVYGSITAA